MVASLRTDPSPVRGQSADHGRPGRSCRPRGTPRLWWNRHKASSFNAERRAVRSVGVISSEGGHRQPTRHARAHAGTIGQHRSTHPVPLTGARRGARMDTGAKQPWSLRFRRPLARSLEETTGTAEASVGVTAAWHRQLPSVDKPETPTATAAVLSGGGNSHPSGRGGCQTHTMGRK